MRNKTNYDDFRFQELQNTFRLPPRNRTYVFYNNTSADFDTILGIQAIGSESCITYFDYYPGTVH
mgnify:CR=1 FL=1